MTSVNKSNNGGLVLHTVLTETDSPKAIKHYEYIMDQYTKDTAEFTQITTPIKTI